MNIVCPFTQEIEHLRKGQGHQKVIGGCGVGNREKHRCFPIPDTVKLQFIVGHDLPELGDVKGGKPGTAGNQNTFGCLARDEKSRTFSSNSQTSYILLNLVAKQTLDFVLHCLSGVLVEVDTDDIGRAVYLLSDGGCGVLGGGLCCCVSVFCHSIPPVNEKCPTRKG